MATDIGIVQGLIELKDDFTSPLKLAEAALSHFTKENQESLIAVAGAAGIVTAALGTVTAATIALGIHGAEVNDVSSTFVTFAGTAQNAKNILEQLRSGTRNTVDDFELMKTSAHLLSAGVKLNADDFGTLANAAFELENRGLGPVKDQLDLVSNALITGRTKALAHALGVVDVTDAHERYAKQLGITAAQLNDTGKAEATRMAVMEILASAAKQGAAQEKDFGDRINESKAFIKNFTDELAGAVAASPVFAAGMEAAGRAVSAAFGNDRKEAIQSVVHFLEQTTIAGVNVGLAMVETARVVNTAWSAVKVLVLGVETAVVGLVTGIGEVLLASEKLAAKLHIVPESEVKQLQETQTLLRAMTVSLAADTAEASKGVVGHSEFDKTLDHLGGTLFQIKDAMSAASLATTENKSEVDKNTKAVKDLGDAHNRAANDGINHAAIEAGLWKIEEKSLQETTALWEQYFTLRTEHGFSAAAVQKQQIESWFDTEVAKLDASDRNFADHYTALRAVADEKLAGIGTDWDALKTKSIDALRETADKEKNTYDQMIEHSSHFTRETLEEQRKKWKDAEDAARGWGETGKNATQQVAAGVTAVTASIKTLAGEIVTITEAEKRRQAGSTVQISPLSATEIKQSGGEKALKAELVSLTAMYGAGGTPPTVTNLDDYTKDLARRARYAQLRATFPGFKEGGIGDFGEGTLAILHGREAIVPLDKSGNTGMGGNITNHFYVNGTGEQVARKTADILMRQLKTVRQFGSA